MEWKVVETIASPESGTLFCKVETHYGLNYILWLKGDYYVRAGEIITTSSQGILINDRRRRVWIAQAMPFTSIGWMGFKRKTRVQATGRRWIARAPLRRRASSGCARLA
ncbi:hypothetical protein [Enterobacter quasihormaechei]|uniref:hypothetical protein n=1 Tax=Enterobacter quasihormaechei TaxID=2529382 RepID=UPI001F47BDB6|nr:hypothetical protein [Enterobacter quasihormaechei]